jgi:hypothetical protein
MLCFVPKSKVPKLKAECKKTKTALTYAQAEKEAAAKGGRLPTSQEIYRSLKTHSSGEGKMPVFNIDMWVPLKEKDGDKDYMEIGRNSKHHVGKSHVLAFKWPKWADNGSNKSGNIGLCTLRDEKPKKPYKGNNNLKKGNFSLYKKGGYKCSADNILSTLNGKNRNACFRATRDAKKSYFSFNHKLKQCLICKNISNLEKVSDKKWKTFTLKGAVIPKAYKEERGACRTLDNRNPKDGYKRFTG